MCIYIYIYTLTAPSHPLWASRRGSGYNIINNMSN